MRTFTPVSKWGLRQPCHACDTAQRVRGWLQFWWCRRREIRRVHLLVSGPCPAERFGEDMRARHKSWMYGVAAAGFALSLAAVGCGDDDTAAAGSGGSSGGSGGSSGAKAGTGGSSGAKAGTGGSSGAKAGTGGGGGAAPTVAECVTATNTNTANTQPAACVMCACMQDPKTLVSCDKTCWAVISCVGTKCKGVPMAMQQACALDKCGTEIGAATNIAAAMGVGPILQGAMCGSKCSPAPDAGVDAGN
jgi:hypothetical protein